MADGPTAILCNELGGRRASLFSSSRYGAQLAAEPWLLARAKPTFFELAMTLTNGNCPRSIATLPSLEALSTTMTSIFSGAVVRRAELMQSQSKSRVFQFTIMIDTSGMARIPRFRSQLDGTHT